MQTINLNYDWKYCETFDDKYILSDCDDSNFQSVQIPHANKEIPYNNFDEEMYQFVSCYRKHLTIPSELKGKKLILEFEAVANYAEVYVNGNLAFSHKGGYTAFRGDIAPYVVFDADNVITVKVDSTERSDIPPFGGVVDYLCYGGIYREVYLYVHDDLYFEKMLLTPQNVLTYPQLQVDLSLNTTPVAPVTTKVCVKDMQGNVVVEQTFDMENSSAMLLLDMQDCVLWDIENPYLYTVTATFNEESIEDRCGMRLCKFKKDGFYLNNKLIKIRGLNRHQAYPYVGYAMPKNAQIDDADFLKKHLGVNLVRTSHYPNSKHFLSRCDENGLLVFTEIPGWQHINKGQEWRDVCVQHVKEMITEDYNHPSIILWGVRINESGDDKELYTATNAMARSLDVSRQTGGVRCIPRSQLLEDVYTYNDFIHTGGLIKLLPKAFVCGNVPYLVTEHSGHMFPTKTFDHEKKRQEHALRHARVMNKMYGTKGISGTIGWCMSDYNTHKDFGSGDKICYHGVTDMFRIDKLAANVYKMQQTATPVLEITSNMEIGDNAGGQVGMVYMLTNCDEVKLYKNGIHINTFNMAEERKHSKFKNLPMAPVVLNDIIGNQLEKDETYHFTKTDARQLKNALLSVKQYGTFGGIFRHPYALLKNLVKYKLSVDTITILFGKYVTGWGSKQVSYRFEGYTNGQHVITCEKGAVNEAKLSAICDRSELIEDETYETARIELKAVSQLNNVLPYDNSVVNVTAKNVEIIGPSQISLIGGQRAVWVKTIGKTGKASVTFDSPTLGKQVINLTVSKK